MDTHDDEDGSRHNTTISVSHTDPITALHKKCSSTWRYFCISWQKLILELYVRSLNYLGSSKTGCLRCHPTAWRGPIMLRVMTVGFATRFVACFHTKQSTTAYWYGHDLSGLICTIRLRGSSIEISVWCHLFVKSDCKLYTCANKKIEHVTTQQFTTAHKVVLASFWPQTFATNTSVLLVVRNWNTRGI